MYDYHIPTYDEIIWLIGMLGTITILIIVVAEVRGMLYRKRRRKRG